MDIDPLDYLSTPWRDVVLRTPDPADAHGLWSVVRAAPVAPPADEVAIPAQPEPAADDEPAAL